MVGKIQLGILYCRANLQQGYENLSDSRKYSSEMALCLLHHHLHSSIQSGDGGKFLPVDGGSSLEGICLIVYVISLLNHKTVIFHCSEFFLDSLIELFKI